MSGTIYNPIRGLYTKQAFGKFLHKGEDAWLQQQGLTWNPSPDAQGAITDVQKWYGKPGSAFTLVAGCLQAAALAMTSLAYLMGMVASKLQTSHPSMCCQSFKKS